MNKMKRLEFKTDAEFIKRFRESLKKLEITDELQVIDFKSKYILRAFVKIVLNTDTVDSLEYDHHINEGSLMYTVRRSA